MEMPIKVQYTYQCSPQKEVELQYNGTDAAWLIDHFIINEVLAAEGAELKFKPLVDTVYGVTGTKASSNQELAKENGITNLRYFIDGRPHQITT